MIYPITFHPDYWDEVLGWKDPFSCCCSTRRQRWCADRLGGSTLFTPQVNRSELLSIRTLEFETHEQDVFFSSFRFYVNQVSSPCAFSFVASNFSESIAWASAGGLQNGC